MLPKMGDPNDLRKLILYVTSRDPRPERRLPRITHLQDGRAESFRLRFPIQTIRAIEQSTKPRSEMPSSAEVSRICTTCPIESSWRLFLSHVLLPPFSTCRRAHFFRFQRKTCPPSSSRPTTPSASKRSNRNPVPDSPNHVAIMVAAGGNLKVHSPDFTVHTPPSSAPTQSVKSKAPKLLDKSHNSRFTRSCGANARKT